MGQKIIGHGQGHGHGNNRGRAKIGMLFASSYIGGGSIMQPISPFLLNISKSSYETGVIGVNGKNRNVIQRIADSILRRNEEVFFVEVCRRLSEAAQKDELQHLKVEDQIQILTKVKEVSSHLTGQIKQTCDADIKILEDKIFERNDKIQGVCKEIFSHIGKNAHQFFPSRKERKKDLQKLWTIMEHYSHDEKAMQIISNHWNAFIADQQKDLRSEKNQKFLQKSNELFLKHFLKTEKPLVVDKNTSLEMLNSYVKNIFEYSGILYQKNKTEKVADLLGSLKEIMQAQQDNLPFIRDSLKEINHFLTLSAFSQSIQQPETKKSQLAAFNECFFIAEAHLKQIENTDPDLVRDLKTKLANLPCPVLRQELPNIYLSHNDQLDILIAGFQKMENKSTNSIATNLLHSNPSGKQIEILVKLIASKSDLSEENRTKLRTALQTRLGVEAPANWDDYQDVKKRMENIFLIRPSTTTDFVNQMTNLKRSSKAKQLFMEQVGREEGMILIPHWYHATSRYNMASILALGQIQVRHEKAFRGAWISAQREPVFGSHVLAFSDRIEGLDPKAFIGFEYQTKRWRGLQRAIPLQESATSAQPPFLAYIGVPYQLNKSAQKTDKLQLIQILKDKGLPNPKAFSSEQLDFIQRQTLAWLGSPNLSDAWWGK